MELNEKNLTAIAALVKVDVEKLKTALTTADGIFETDVKHFFTDNERKTLLDNTQKDGYNTGKKAGEEMQFKTFRDKYKDDFKIEVENITDFEKLFDVAFEVKGEKQKLEIESLKEKLTGDTKNISEKYEAQLKNASSEKSALQTAIEQLKIESANAISSLTSKYKDEKSQSIFISNLNNVPFVVPANVERLGADATKKYLQVEKEKFKTFFLSQHTLKFDENNKLTVLKDGEILKDNLQEPVKLTDLLIPFARKFQFQLEKDAGTKNRSQGNKNVEFTGMSEVDFRKNFDLRTNEGIKKFADWEKANK